ncbi:MAG: hypothetical protein HYY06_23950 [Deltaproteobacteria bacterium]|nr:hypothetical protein [Deltaproteobacteria bacterium]
MSNLVQRPERFSCRENRVLVALVALAISGAALGCAGTQSARVSIDGRDYFVPPGKRARHFGPGRRGRTPGGTEGEIVRALSRATGERVASDPRLQRVAELLFAEAGADLLPSEALMFAIRYRGVIDGAIADRSFESPSRASLVRQISRWASGTLRGPAPPNRVGVVVRPVTSESGDWSVRAFVLLSWHYVEVEPVPQRAKRGSALRLRARALAPFARPSVSVTLPGGAVVEHPAADGTEIQIALPTRKRGRMDVQVSAEIDGRADVVATFPIWVDRAPPARMRLRPPDSPDAFVSGMIRLANEERRERGLDPFEVLPLLGHIALAHARGRATSGSEEEGVLARLRAAGFCGDVATWSSSRWGSARQLHRERMRNAEYVRILQSADATHIGIGAVGIGQGAALGRAVHTTLIIARRGWQLGRRSCPEAPTPGAGPSSEPPPAAAAEPAPPAPGGSPPQVPPPIVPNVPAPPTSGTSAPAETARPR